MTGEPVQVDAGDFRRALTLIVHAMRSDEAGMRDVIDDESVPSGRLVPLVRASVSICGSWLPRSETPPLLRRCWTRSRGWLTLKSALHGTVRLPGLLWRTHHSEAPIRSGGAERLRCCIGLGWPLWYGQPRWHELISMLPKHVASQVISLPGV